MSAVPDDIAADFIIEAQEILDRLGEQLVSLEHAPEDSEQLNAVFRGFHTLKGGAGFLAINAMVELCHAAEDTLGQARAGQATLQARHFDAAQQSLDYLQSMLDAFGSGSEPPRAPQQLIAQFATSGEETAVVPAAVAGPATGDRGPGKSAADSELISDDEFEALLDNLHGGGTPSAIAQRVPVPGPRSPVPAAPKAAAAPAKASEPEQTVRVDTKRLDAIVNLIGELVLSRNRLKTLRVRLRDEELDRAVSSLDIATSRLQSAVMRTRMQPVGKVFSRFPKVARDVARSLNKEVDLELIGADTELDRNLVEALADPLVHLVRNAIDHGIETPALREATGKPRGGHVRLSAQQEGDYVSIEVQDDGAGIDPERLRQKAREKGLIDPEAAARLTTEECLHLVFLPGFSTKAEVTDISGRGVGMDVVQSRIRELSGQIQIQSELGRGSRFLIRVPLTLAILPTLLVQAGDTVYALPLARVVEVLHAPRRALGWFDGRAVLDRQSHTLPLVDLRHWLNIEAPELPLLTVVVLQAGESRMGLVVDQVRGREEVVIKPLPRALRGLPGYAGATLIGDGRLALILDVDGLKS
ncbi:chemotaxis protein CheA [Xanthomonas translucens]|uniref:Chemotaxis protein CheA n=2 Tax=Xanthomonas campestris pv. translucens TaxID=343 RepID=A0A1C3TPE2_XANCT|nr:chemotaxis protein CheA [Xanthomonas translucens]KWV12242.1 chemotaxis protein CheA [Xanthomonas translucens]MCC8445998.1 chemotaxis protein CheA [Xanthomonas translucens pv. translucens]MCS3361073.1 chemotaxis protein CheA [Xanthomonas translucens pv. translucens]MCS3373514.1 chemotaxis protein CheA [Xanthomonas translucens pv. translucens]MCT8274712.1 chemotaxis protein CheA [Xanthomonas translucens pv. translucens]